MVKKPIVSIRIYRGQKLYYNEHQEIENENQLITYTYNTLSWRLFLKHIGKHGYAAVKVEEVYYSEIKLGKEVVDKSVPIDIVNSVKNEVEKAFNISEESLLTPEQKKIKELEEKINKLLKNSNRTQELNDSDIKPEEKEEMKSLRSEYYDLAEKRCSPKWDKQTLEQKIKELKESKELKA